MTYQGEYTREFEHMNRTLDKILKVLEEIAKNVKWIEQHTDRNY